jgi:hypothetical protein
VLIACVSVLSIAAAIATPVVISTRDGKGAGTPSIQYNSVRHLPKRFNVLLTSQTSSATPKISLRSSKSMGQISSPTTAQLSSAISMSTLATNRSPTPTPALNIDTFTVQITLSTFQIITSTLPITPTPRPQSEAKTSHVRLLPGAKCKADSECIPYNCYKTPGATATCCGPSIWGCPGYNCAASGDNGCLDPYKCATAGTKTCIFS